ncbi:MAG: hypothetical protein Kow0092_37930 [Deferrisomatales bacterium]
MNDPSSYYAGAERPSLCWELTICQSLAGPASPHGAALRRPAPYGRLLAEFLAARVGLAPSWSVVELGGGYGSLMKAFLETVPLGDVTLVDVSPTFTAAQRQALGEGPGRRFVTADAFEFLRELSEPVDLVIANEVLGDLPTVTDLPREALEEALHHDPPGPLGEVARRVRRYGLDLADAPERFHFNLGALQLLEALAPRARVVFLSEHGADTVLPKRYAFLPLPPGDGYPRRIPLKGHDEYTIRFAHLVRAAGVLGYQVHRIHMAELVGLRDDPGLQAMARTRTTATETAEVVHEFCEHVAEYQCLVLVAEGTL